MKPVVSKEKLYWVLQAGGWGLYTLINYLSLPLFDMKLPYSGAFMILSLFAGIGVTHAYRNYMLRRRWFDLNLVVLVRNIFLGAAVLTVLYFVVLTLMDVVIFLASWLVAGYKLPEQNAWNDDYWAFVYLSLINVYAVFLVWSVLYFVFKYFENYQKAKLRQLEAQSRLKDAMLLNLRNQLNPHFLFNALNSIRSLTISDATRARTAVTLLSDLLRYSLNSEQKNFVTLKEELAVVKDYLELEKIRFDERLHFTIHADEATLPALIPPLAVMTLAENAIKHGIGRLTQGGEVNVTATRHNDTVIVEVSNSGTFSPNGNSGIGLANTRQRLNILYNQNATFDIGQQNGLVAARLQIPFTP